MDAFKAAQELYPNVEREKVEGFVLLVGAGPTIVDAGADRDAAVQKAVDILKERDTVIVLSKLQSKFGEILITKDQLILSRTNK